MRRLPIPFFLIPLLMAGAGGNADAAEATHTLNGIKTQLPGTIAFDIVAKASEKLANQSFHARYAHLKSIHVYTDIGS